MCWCRDNEIIIIIGHRTSFEQTEQNLSLMTISENGQQTEQNLSLVKMVNQTGLARKIYTCT